MLNRRPEVPVGELLDEIGHLSQCLRWDIAHGQADKGGGKSGLALWHNVRASPHLKRRFGTAIPVAVRFRGLDQLRRRIGDDRQIQTTVIALANHGIFRIHTAFELFKAKLIDDELHPCLVAIFAIAEIVEDFDDRVAQRQQILHRKKLAEHLGEPWSRAEAATGGDAEADFAVGSRHGEEPQIVYRRHGAVLSAAGQRDFELPREALVKGIAQQVLRDRLSVRSHVKDLSLADTGEMAGGHVADCVAARFSGREAHGRQAPHDRAHVLECHEVELNILPRRHMTDPRRIGLRHIGNRTHLLGVQASEGDLDPDHLHTGLALTIDAVLEAEGAEYIGRNFGIQDFGGFLLEGFDLL